MTYRAHRGSSLWALLDKKAAYKQKEMEEIPSSPLQAVRKSMSMIYNSEWKSLSQLKMDGGGVSKAVAVVACAAMALFYVAILYAPTLILRLPPPPSFKNFMIRRFICAAISSVVSVVVSALLLPVSSTSSLPHFRFNFSWSTDPVWIFKFFDCWA